MRQSWHESHIWSQSPHQQPYKNPGLLSTHRQIPSPQCGTQSQVVFSLKLFLMYLQNQNQNLKTDPAGVQAVADWPTPTTLKQLQHLGFYRRFYQELQPDGVSSHQTDLSAIPFTWTSEVETAFHTLTQLFNGAPVLKHPDPKLQFDVEVDASKHGKGRSYPSTLPRTTNCTACLPSPSMVADATWEVETLILEAQCSHPDPGNGPPKTLFVPESAMSQVLQWGHSKLTCHPGLPRTSALYPIRDRIGVRGFHHKYGMPFVGWVGPRLVSLLDTTPRPMVRQRAILPLGYQTHFFPVQGEDVMVLSIQANPRRCQRVWKEAGHALLPGTNVLQTVTIPLVLPISSVRRCGYPPGIYLSRSSPRNWPPGPFEITKIINPSALTLKLLSSMKIHPTFHVSLLKPVTHSPLSPPATPPPPTRITDDHPDFTVRRPLDIRHWGRGYQYFADWEGCGLEQGSATFLTLSANVKIS